MMSTLRRTLRDAITPDRRAALRIRQHNLAARRDAKLATLGHRRVADEWEICDGSAALRIPSLARWSRYRRGVEQGCREAAGVYAIGTRIDVGPGDIVIEVGANIGEVSLACARLGATVHAIEADPRTRAMLESNVRGVADITVHGFAASDHIGTVTFFQATGEADGSTIEPDRYDAEITVEARTLDEFAAGEGLGSVHLIKCDAEGAEPEVLAGATDLLQRTTWVTLDCGPERRGEPTIVECSEILRAAGFTVTQHEPEIGRQIVIGHRA